MYVHYEDSMQEWKTNHAVEKHGNAIRLLYANAIAFYLWHAENMLEFLAIETFIMF